MTIKIHYTVNGFEDSIIMTGDTIEDIRNRAQQELDKRGLDREKNNCWTEEIGVKGD